MSAGTYHITIEQGAVFERVITVNGRDLTSYKARMHIRRRIGDDDPLLELTSDGADGRIAITPGTDSVITLTIAATDTAELATNGVYDLELVPPGVDGEDEVERLLQGNVILSPEVTR